MITTYVRAGFRVGLFLTLAIFIFSCKKDRSEDQKESFLKFYGSSFYDQGFHIAEVPGGYVILGNTTVPGVGDVQDQTDIALWKVDEFGDQVWVRRYNFDNRDTLGYGKGNDEGRSLEITPEGDFLITGFVTFINEEGEEADKSICLIKADPSGNQIWAQIYADKGPGAGPGEPRPDQEGYGLEIIGDSIYISGTTTPLPPTQQNSKDIIVIQTDLNGVYGTNNIETKEGIDEVGDLISRDDIGIIIGESESDLYDESTVMFRTFETRKSTLGTASSVYNTDDASSVESGVTGLIVENNNVVLLSNRISGSGANSVYVEEFAFTGGLDKTLSNVWFSELRVNGADAIANDINSTSDGGYIITGYTLASNRDRDLFLLKIDNVGNKQWEQTFGSSQQNEQGESVVQTSDGSYVILGSSGFDETRIGNTSLMIIKTTPEGELK